MDTTNLDPRHQRRQQIVQQLFAQNITPQPELGDAAKVILKRQADINTLIEKAAPLWPFEQINRIDIAILQLAIFELEQKKEPVKVVIDEAIELAKEFGGDNSPAFVNGVLGKIVEEQKPDDSK